MDPASTRSRMSWFDDCMSMADGGDDHAERTVLASLGEHGRGQLVRIVETLGSTRPTTV